MITSKNGLRRGKSGRFRSPSVDTRGAKYGHEGTNMREAKKPQGRTKDKRLPRVSGVFNIL
jgi:hypothetical protein